MSEYVKPKTNPYVMDFCLCIDGSAAMSGAMDTVKQQVKTIRDASVPGMEEASDVRVKVIVFRDYACDGDAAMEQSEFFDLNDPDGQEAFNRFVDGIEACGGSGSPNALEAISLALRSDWKRIG
ncbi:MAG: VWA domain-containing protein, partial [Clostridia bacterium]|nr:VWA domain-containing protein [Clostridia bacterium]